jgi:hypothetical protein
VRRTPALLTLVLLTFAALWGAGPAVAGGPTSVLVSVPGEGRVAALYHTDAPYQALEALSGELNAEVHPAARARPGGGAEPVATFTWLIHDVQVWRMDQVYLNADGAPWVERREVVDGGSVWDAPATWHRANPKLPGLVDEVLRYGRAAAMAQPPPTDAEAPSTRTWDPARATPAAAAPAAPSVDEDGSSLTTAAWTGSALLAGAVAGAALMWLVLRRRDDEGPATEPSATEPPAAAVDQLAWP